MFRVNGKYLDHEDIIYDYRCKACGGKLYCCDGGLRYQCKDCKRYISDASGLTTKPYKPLTGPVEPQGTIYFPTSRGTLPFSVVVNDYTCACGAPLEIDGETLRCAGPGRHVIRTGDDVKSKYRRVENFADAEAFVEGYLFWNQGEATMAGRLKDRTTISTGLKRAGKVRLGYKVALLDENGKPRKYRGGPMQGQPMYKPVNVDYFVLKDAPAVAEAYADHPSVIKDKYGSGPTELLVFLPFDEASRVFEARYEWRKGPILYCAGDGEFIDYALSADGLHTVIRNGFAAQDYHDDEWSLSKGAQVACSGMGAMGEGLWPRCANCTAHDGKAAMTLRVMVRDPEAPMTVVRGEMAYYEIHTSSNVTYDLLVEQIDKYAGEAARAGGKLTGIPFRLTRVPTEMSYVQKDRSGAPVKRAVVEHALMNIEPDPEWVKAMTIFSYQRAVMLDEPDAPAPIEYALPAGNGSKGEDEQVVEPEGDVADDDGVIEGEFSESGDVEPEPENEALDPRNTPRPWPPELLKSVFQHNVAKRAEKGGNAGSFYPQERRQALVSRVDDLFDGDPAKRRAFLEYVFGVTSSAQMTVAMADVLENWLGSNGHTGAEALAVVALDDEDEPGVDDFLGPKRGVKEQFEEDAEAEQAGLPGMEAA